MVLWYFDADEKAKAIDRAKALAAAELQAADKIESQSAAQPTEQPMETVAAAQLCSRARADSFGGTSPVPVAAVTYPIQMKRQRPSVIADSTAAAAVAAAAAAAVSSSLPTVTAVCSCSSSACSSASSSSSEMIADSLGLGRRLGSFPDLLSVAERERHAYHLAQLFRGQYPAQMAFGGRPPRAYLFPFEQDEVSVPIRPFTFDSLGLMMAPPARPPPPPVRAAMLDNPRST